MLSPEQLKQIEAAREKIADEMWCLVFPNRTCSFRQLQKTVRDEWKTKARRLLSLPELAILDSDQNLPQRGINVCANCWITSQQDMLSANFKRIIPKEKME